MTNKEYCNLMMAVYSVGAFAAMGGYFAAAMCLLLAVPHVIGWFQG